MPAHKHSTCPSSIKGMISRKPTSRPPSGTLLTLNTLAPPRHPGEGRDPLLRRIEVSSSDDTLPIFEGSVFAGRWAPAFAGVAQRMGGRSFLHARKRWELPVWCVRLET